MKPSFIEYHMGHHVGKDISVLIVAPFCSLPGECRFNRFLYLAEYLSDEYNVTLVTSSFSHADKKQRKIESKMVNGFRLDVLPVPGYAKNVSLKRVFSHSVFVNRLRRWLDLKGKQYDVVYSAYPLIETNVLLGERKAALGYKLVLDIQDVWPESFSSVIPILKKIDNRFIPFSRKADRAYSQADALVAVSKTYLDRGLMANQTSVSCVTYIGSDWGAIERVQPHRFSEGAVRFFYLGTLSYSYDVETVIKGVNILNGEGLAVELHVFGGGPDLERYKSTASEAVKFYGYLPYELMVHYCKGCDFAVNAIKSHASQTITNKLSDYIALNKPILNSQEGPEVEQLLGSIRHRKYQSGSVASFIASAREMIDKYSGLDAVDDRAQLANLFDRRVSYGQIKRVVGSVL